MKEKLSSAIISENRDKLLAIIHKHNLEGVYISSFDPYLNEYVPMNNCHRYFFTGFSGSVAEVFVPKEGRIKLYVDGRYYEQADLEVDAKIVEVVKVPSSMGLSECLLKDIKELKKIGIEGKRTSLSFYNKLTSLFDVHVFVDEVEVCLNKPKAAAFKEIFEEDLKLVGKSTREKLKLISNTSFDAFYVTSLDSLSWLTNLRGFHLPFQSAFVGKGIALKDKVIVFLDDETPIHKDLKDQPEITFKKISEFKEVLLNLHLKNIAVDPSMLNVDDYKIFIASFGEEGIIKMPEGLTKYHSIKDEAELNTIRAAFNLGDQAIYNTICEIKKRVSNGDKVSELDLYHETTKQYQKMGAIEQSFNTIAGVGANGSIIHYGDPKADVYMDKDDMVLLDSGAYFKGGFATDTTRTFAASFKGTPSLEHQRIYTLTLKAVLALQYAVFPEGTKGCELDAITRRAIWSAGLNYNHGTGHGVGINVHEGGVRISPLSNLPMKENQVVSLEPGIYIPGFGGVRLENIAIVKKHPTFKGMLSFECLVYIGFEPNLINNEMLTFEEKEWLAHYEAECKKRRRSFNA